jgi:genome maintenance exonuclease 1
VYHTPVGDLRSVTTRIGDKSDNTWLKEWRARVGDEVADQVSRQACTRGTSIHSLAEKYLMNDPLWKKGSMPINTATFLKLKSVLDQRVGVIYGIEYPLYSKFLQTAGKTDLVAEFDGIDSIIDFKTSKKLKTKEDIPGYFIQSTCYSLMFEELTGKRIKQIAVILAVDEDESQVFIEKPSTWYSEVQRVFCT